MPAPLRLADAAACVDFERDSFGALHQMLAGLDEEGRRAAWDHRGLQVGVGETMLFVSGLTESLKVLQSRRRLAD